MTAEQKQAVREKLALAKEAIENAEAFLNACNGHEACTECDSARSYARQAYDLLKNEE